jgi:hypothetical protein
VFDGLCNAWNDQAANPAGEAALTGARA